MGALRKKLNSKTGSSLIMTMVYFLFCIFVGGSVLAAATANSGRLVHQKASRQNYYIQRSAALLLKEQMQNIPGVQIVFEKRSTFTIAEAGTGSEFWMESNPSQKVVFAEQIGGTYQNELQKIVIESAESLFWKEKYASEDYKSYFDQVYRSATGEAETQIMQSNLKLETGFLKLTVDGTQTAVDVKYTCSYEEEGSEDIRFSLDILDDNGKTIFTVCATGAVRLLEDNLPFTDVIQENRKEEKGNRTKFQMTWANATIQKGGAS